MLHSSHITDICCSLPARQEREKYEQQSRQLKEEALAKAAEGGAAVDVEEPSTVEAVKKAKKVSASVSSANV